MSVERIASSSFRQIPSPERIKDDRVDLIAAHSEEAMRLFWAPWGLDTKNINELSLDALKLAIKYPGGANCFFGGPGNLSLEMNKISSDKLELILKYPHEARRLFRAKEFFAVIEADKLELFLTFYEAAEKIFCSEDKWDFNEIKRLSLDAIRKGFEAFSANREVAHRYASRLLYPNQVDTLPQWAPSTSAAQQPSSSQKEPDEFNQAFSA